jgi:hypothetical protein
LPKIDNKVNRKVFFLEKFVNEEGTECACVCVSIKTANREKKVKK